MSIVMDEASALLLAGMKAAGGKPLYQQSIEEIRAGVAGASQLLAPPVVEVHSAVDRRIAGSDGGIAVRIYTPRPLAADERLPIVLHFHGGGFVAGSVETHDAIARQLSHRADAIVIGVDYRLAPEHRYPAAVNDAYGALTWAARHADEFQGDAARIAVAGDSAGGNLAAAITLMARERGGPRIAFQALMYPTVDFEQAAPYASKAEFGGGDFFLSVTDMEFFRAQYLADVPGQMLDPHASPMQAVDLTGLPPALIVTAGCDPLRDEGNAYADRLAAAGVAVERRCFEGTIHAFMSFAAAIPLGLDALSWVASRLHAALYQEQPA